ncbi:MAG: AAA family ATPase [Desulfococcaceae bacterium]
MILDVPAFSLILLVGPSGTGKSTFAARHFSQTEVVSSDRCRAMIVDDEAEQRVTPDAFELLNVIVSRRLKWLRLTVVDATSLEPKARRSLLDLAKRHHCEAVAVVLDLPPDLCRERNAARADRRVEPEVIDRQFETFRSSIKRIGKEGFRSVFRLDSPETVENARFRRERMPPDFREETGPFDIIGDIHGCGDELEELLDRLGYRSETDGGRVHPEGRKVLFLGDLTDRGPRNVWVVRTALAMARESRALACPGNHDDKLVRMLRGRDVKVDHGLERTRDDFDALPEAERERLAANLMAFYEGLPSHYVLDGGNLVAAHAGLRADLQGRVSPKVRKFALFGDITGKKDEHGLPVRGDWAANYRGRAMVVYGHSPVKKPVWRRRTINIDTGCVFGGRLTALRYPELELVSVAARKTYVEPPKPFLDEEGREGE